MADVRRRNLDEGIQELWSRKRDTDQEERERRFKKLNQHRDSMLAPQRADEVFTETTIPAAVLQTNVPQDPGRFDRALESVARTDLINASKSQARIDALQHLYMLARDFIVDEKALEAEVERQFRPGFFAEGVSGAGRQSENAWDYYGTPVTVQSMVGDAMRTDRRAVIAGKDEGDRTAQRQLKVAEELTGGPLDEV
jgi:hypothetical protein